MAIVVPEMSRPHAQPAGPAGVGPATILVVDDLAFNRRLVGRIVGGEPGWRAAYACHGGEALEVIARESPHAVVTDLRMPVMDGLELVGEVRRRHPLIPVVLMTAHGGEEIGIRALRLGAASYIPKHDLTRELPGILRQALAVAVADPARRRVPGDPGRRESSYDIASDPALIQPLLARIREDHLAAEPWDETTRIRVGIALEEALLNALYHGNLEVSSDLRLGDEKAYYRLAEHRRRTPPYRDRRIHVRAGHQPGAATFVIRDEGPGFDVPPLDRPIDPESLLRPSGRGLLLIRTFMDSVSFNSAGNEITMIKRRGCGGAPT